MTPGELAAAFASLRLGVDDAARLEAQGTIMGYIAALEADNAELLGHLRVVTSGAFTFSEADAAKLAAQAPGEERDPRSGVPRGRRCVRAGRRREPPGCLARHEGG